MWIISNLNPKVLFYFPIKIKAVVLTVDDSPSNQTDEFLDLFKQYNVHATFFVIGNKVKGREEKLKRMIEEGHEIGNHTYCDEPSFKNTPQEFAEKVGKTSDILEEYTIMQKHKWFRPGSGIPSSFMYNYLDNHGYRLVVGSCHAFDAQIENCSYTSFILRHGVSYGDIVIVHDRSYTLPEVESLLKYCQEKEIRVMSLGEMADYVHNSQYEDIKLVIPKPRPPFSHATPDSFPQSPIDFNSQQNEIITQLL